MTDISEQSSFPRYKNDTVQSATMISLQNYANIVKSICKSSGLFKNRYKQAETQLVNMNRIMEQIKNTAIPSIKNDLYNITLKNINWKNYNDRLKSELSNKIPQDNVFYLRELSFDNDEDVPQISTDYINNMNLAIFNLGITENTKAEELTLKQKKKINNYIEIRDDLFNEIDSNLDDFREYEKNITDCRAKNIPILKDNINILYNAHLKYVYNKVNKKLEHVRVYYGQQEILLQDSQKEFIMNSLKIILK